MTPAEAQALLAIAASFDNRKPDADAAKGWSVALNGLTFVDCRDAIVEHYSATTTWLMPAHVRTIVRRTRSKRIAEEHELTPPPGLDPDRTADYAKWLVESRENAAAGETGPAAIGGRNIAELGTVGQPIDVSERVEALRAARRAAVDVLKVAEAEREEKRREDRAARATARQADRKARAAKDEGVGAA